MPRSRTIAWQQRVTIFLTYRRFGKVYPTAKALHIARSTVEGIVKEFEVAGFSRQPRVSLSVEVLTRAQERHLAGVATAFREVARAPLFPELTPLLATAGAARAAGDGDEATAELSPVLAWHWRGTPAERLVEDVERQVQTYARERRALWGALRSSFEETAGFPVLAFPAVTAPGQQASYVEELMDALCRECLGEANLLRQHPPSQWKAQGWQLHAGVVVAIGDPARHGTLREGAERFLRERLGEFKGRAAALVNLHHDLLYVDEVVQEALAAVTDEDIQRGICPECPYPEGVVQAAPPRKSRKRRGT